MEIGHTEHDVVSLSKPINKLYFNESIFFFLMII